MVDPTTAAAGAIAKLAFDEFVKSGAGELAKKSLGAAITQVDELRKKIRTKFKGDVKAENALAAIEQEHSQPALTKLKVYLEDAMTDDPQFAQELRQLAQKIINSDTQMNMENRDNSKGYQVQAGKIDHLGDNYTN